MFAQLAMTLMTAFASLGAYIHGVDAVPDPEGVADGNVPVVDVNGFVDGDGALDATALDADVYFGVETADSRHVAAGGDGGACNEHACTSYKTFTEVLLPETPQHVEAPDLP